MSEGYDLMLEQRALTAEMNQCLSAMKKTALELSQNEHDYRVALAKKILSERANGTPVTIISDVSRGDPEVAALKFARDTAEAKNKAASEAVNVYKLRLRLLEGQINREWAGNGVGA